MGHFGQWPARGKTCRKCRGKDHFEKVLKTKSYAVRLRGYPMIMTLDPSMTMHSVLQKQNTQKWSIDSGENSNIIDEGIWKQLKMKGVKCESQAATSDKKLYPYASSQPLPVG